MTNPNSYGDVSKTAKSRDEGKGARGSLRAWLKSRPLARLSPDLGAFITGPASEVRESWTVESEHEFVVGGANVLVFSCNLGRITLRHGNSDLERAQTPHADIGLRQAVRY